jgi:redox-sensitive bicupin YhaK (pirin superfamily)
MSTLPANEPACLEEHSSEFELVIDARPRDLGGFSVRRVLPSIQRRLVGPFIFFDQMGPARFAVGRGIDVRPHPHIALATLTYLFEGEIIHRDSLGSFQPIRPGDVNWMVAGHGIVHSERSSPEARARGSTLHGIQSWIALPRRYEETEPRFDHHPARTIPIQKWDGVEIGVVAGTAYGLRSPVAVFSPTLYVAVTLAAGAELPIDEEHTERALYVVEGAVSAGSRIFSEGTMGVLREGARVRVRAQQAARLMLIGGAPLDGERHIEWNFVSSSKERIERAKADWQRDAFAKVPGDEHERIPLPDTSPH